MEIVFLVSLSNCERSKLIIPDLVLHCSTARSAEQSIQIWLNRDESGYELSRTYDLPHGSGPLSFADMSESHSHVVNEG